MIRTISCAGTATTLLAISFSLHQLVFQGFDLVRQAGPAGQSAPVCA